MLRLSGIEKAIPVVQSVACLLYRKHCPGCLNAAYLALLSVTRKELDAIYRLNLWTPNVNYS